MGSGSAGRGLRPQLVALVLIPLLGLTAFATVQVKARVQSESAARAAQGFVRDAGAVDTARTAILRETIPAVSVAIQQVPALRLALGLPALAGRQVDLTPATVATLRSVTDTALRSGELRSGVRADILAAQPILAKARASIDTGSDLQGGYSSMLSMGQTLGAVENRQIGRADALGLNASVAAALNDTVLVARAAQLGSQEYGLFASIKLLVDPAAAGASQAAWASLWGGFQIASATIKSSASEPVRQAWTTAASTASFVQFDDVVRPSIVSGSVAPTKTSFVAGLTAVVAALRLNDARNQQFTGILNLAADRAAHAAGQQRSSAQQALELILAISVLLILASIGVALLAYRSLATPLTRLSEQATQLSEGELPDVVITGPREIQTVARGLSAAVATLRRIQDQAAAVAAGELDSDVVRQPVPGRLGAVVHNSVIQIVTAIQARETAQSELAHLAAHDALTGLANRAQALALIERSLHRAQRTASMTGLMFIDLDHFKTVNDTFGHGAGDIVLQIAADRMLGVVRDGDTVSRLGGDEFVILLEDVDSEADFVKLAERVIEVVSEPMVVGDRTVTIGASVGVALCRDSYVEASRLLHEADAAVYDAKNLGRGRVGIFDDELRVALRERADLEAAIAAGLEREEFVLHYQPVVELKSGRTLGVEALIRWHRPDHGMVAPDDFIPVAELSTLIDDIGRWALTAATAQLAAWQAADPSAAELTMAVNISGRHLTSNTLISDVSRALQASNIEPSRLVIEVTETVLVDDPVATTNMLALRALGVKIAIDDFGTGFTSIGQLPKLPVDTLKIDRSFISSPDPAHRELVRLIVSAAHAFGLTVVAEGIEHAHEAEALKSANAEIGQGFFFARPQPAAHYDSAETGHWDVSLESNG